MLSARQALATVLLLAWITIHLGTFVPLGCRLLQQEQQAQEQSGASKTQPKRCQSTVSGFVAYWTASPTDLAAGITALATIAIAGFTLTLWLATSQQGRITEAALRLARDEFDATHRPKIRIKHVWILNDVWEGERIDIRLIFTNVGTSPASIESWGFATFLVPGTNYIPPDLRYPIRQGASTTIMVPGFTFDWQGTDGRSLMRDEIQAVRAGRQQLICIGHIQYLDTTSAPKFRRTNFCRVLDVAAQLVAHEEVSRFRVYKDSDYEYED